MQVSDVMDVPLPPKRSIQAAKYPFVKLQVGQMFAVAVGPNESFVRVRNRISSVATRYAKKLGAKFSIRRLDDKTLGVWRVA